MTRNKMLATFCACMFVALGVGCAGDESNRVSSSGDPEADHRAEQRTGSDEGDQKDKGPRTLYERMGGEKTMIALVEDMTARVIADPRVNFERKDVHTNWIGGDEKAWKPTEENVSQLKRHMVEFLTLAAGGPATYSGRNMAEVHKGMKITNNEFDAMVGDVKASLDKLGISTDQQKSLLAIVETTRKQIVEER